MPASVTSLENRHRVISILVLLICLGTALLLIQQRRTIESQRTLIQQLLTDSVKLSAVKARMARDDAQEKQAAPAKRHAPAAPRPDGCLQANSASCS